MNGRSGQSGSKRKGKRDVYKRQGAQSMAFKRIASGMLVAIGPNVVPLIINASTMVG